MVPSVQDNLPPYDFQITVRRHRLAHGAISATTNAKRPSSARRFTVACIQTLLFPPNSAVAGWSAITLTLFLAGGRTYAATLLNAIFCRRQTSAPLLLVTGRTRSSFMVLANAPVYVRLVPAR